MIIYIIQFLIGVFSKLTDAIADDGFKLFKNIEYLFGLIYGLLIAYLIINFAVIRPLLFGTILAVILTKKIDHKAHYLGISIPVVSLFFIYLLKINYLLLVIFLFAALWDEILNDYFDKKKIKNKISKILKYRIILETTALIVSIILNQWVFFFAILSFDFGYIMMDRLTNKNAFKVRKTT
jgi:hypothetical protein